MTKTKKPAKPKQKTVKRTKVKKATAYEVRLQAIEITLVGIKDAINALLSQGFTIEKDIEDSHNSLLKELLTIKRAAKESMQDTSPSSPYSLRCSIGESISAEESMRRIFGFRKV